MFRLPRMLFDKAGDGDGGAAGDKGKDPGTDTAKELEALKTTNASLLARLEKLEGKSQKDDDDVDDDDLRDKAKKQREADDKQKGASRALENALKFSLNAENWIKSNQSLLPKTVPDIFKTADKENFESAVEKDSAIKAGIIQEFFTVQANLDLLTPGLKTVLDDYLKLTKTGKQEKALQIYDQVFEPALEMLRRVKKAEALQKGYGSSSDNEDAYKQKMINLSRKHYLGEKHGA
jgi:hypothetical protein